MHRRRVSILDLMQPAYLPLQGVPVFDETSRCLSSPDADYHWLHLHTMAWISHSRPAHGTKALHLNHKLLPAIKKNHSGQKYVSDCVFLI